MTLEQLAIFVKVIDAGGFTRAADLLGLQRSNVSRAIARLEAELRVVLVERTTRAQSITEAGQAVYQRAVGILAAVEDTVRVTRNTRDRPRGVLRVACGVEFGMVAMGTLVERFLARHPAVSADVEYTSREIDLVHEGFDLAIRSGDLPDSSLVSRVLGRLDYGLFASPAYLAAAGTPQATDDLAAHSLVVFSGGNARAGLVLAHPARRDQRRITTAPRLRVNAGTGVLSALLGGFGIGQLPTVVAAEHVARGALVAVMAEWRAPSVPVHAVFAGNRYLTPKVRAFVDLCIEEFPWVTLDPGQRPALA